MDKQNKNKSTNSKIAAGAKTNVATAPSKQSAAVSSTQPSSSSPKTTNSQRQTQVPLGNVPSGIKPTGVWTTVHEGMRSGDRRHGRLEKRDHATGIWIRGEERLASTASSLADGQVVAIISLNPKTFGPRTELMSFPYAKFKFTKLRLRFVTGSSTQTAGVMYMGCYLDPDQAIPQGAGAAIAWTELAENTIEFQAYANADLQVQLRLDEQDPCFIDNTGDQRFGSQGNIFLGAGTFTGTVIGQMFVEYECKLIDENMEPIPSGVLMASTDLIASGATANAVFASNPINVNPNSTVGPYTNYVGDRTILVATDTPTGSNVLLPKIGLYEFVAFSKCQSAAQQIVNPPTLVCNSGCFSVSAFDYGGGNIAGSSDWEQYTVQPIAGPPFNRVTGSGVTNTNTGPGAICSAWLIGVISPNATLTMTMPTTSGGSIKSFLIMSRVGNNSGIAANIRNGPVAVAADGKLMLCPSTVDYLAVQQTAVDFDAQTQLCIARACGQCDPGDSDNAAVVMEALLPDIAYVHKVNWASSAACANVVHPALGAVAWLVKTLGPLVVSKMLELAKDKVEKWIKEHKK